MIRPFSLLVKPAGRDCNLDCPYCFYKRNPAACGPHCRMRPELLEKIVGSYLDLPLPRHEIAFQGGEPLLAGEDFFRLAARCGKGCSFSVQTNATLVTDSIAGFFAEESWLVGTSPHGRSPAFMEGYERLVAAGVETNVLQLVTKENAASPEELYFFLRDGLGATRHQYIECTWPREYAITAAEWERFLTRLYDVWMSEGDEGRVSVGLFDAIATMMSGLESPMCPFSDDCRHHLVVEADGSVYPCDFHVRDDLRLGNAATDSWESIVSSPAYEAFGRRKRGHRDCPRNNHSLDSAYSAFFARFVRDRGPVQGAGRPPDAHGADNLV